jgi:hypothetical protein
MITDEQDYETGRGLMWQSSAILALQEATEAFLVGLFEDSYVHVRGESFAELMVSCSGTYALFTQNA